MGKLSTWPAADMASRLSKPGRGRSKPTGDGWKAPCPAHDDRTPSLSLTNTPEGKLLWYCFGGCSSDDVRRALLGVIGEEDMPEPSEGEAQRVKEKVEDPRRIVFPVPVDASYSIDDFHHSTYGAPTRVWTYRLPGGLVGGWVARYDLGDGAKEVLPWVWSEHRDTGQQELRMKSMPDPRPLYNLDRIVANPDAVILLSEGEKAADASDPLFPDWIPTAIPGGGSAVRMADLAPFANRTVVMLADHDAPGYEFALRIIAQAPPSCDLRMLVWPQRWPASAGGTPYVMKKGDDAWDHVDAGWTTELLREATAETGRPLVHRVEYLPEESFEVIQYPDGRPS